MSKQDTSGAAAIARSVALAVRAENYAVALAAIDEGEASYPDASLPEGATWSKLRTVVQSRMPEPEPEQDDRAAVLAAAVDSGRVAVAHVGAPEVAQEPEAGQEPQAAQEAETPAEPETVLAALTIVHTIEGGTVLVGAPKGEIGKRISQIMGKNGQRWSFSYSLPSGPGWYIRGSRPGGADMPRVGAARKALQVDGFSVDLDIHTTDADGKVVAPKLTKAEQLRRARARSRAIDSLGWHLSCTESGLPCSETQCDVAGLRPQTSRIIDDPVTGQPRVVCLAHAGEATVVPMPEQPAAPVLPELDEQDQDQAEQEPDIAPDAVHAAKPAKVAEVVEPAGLLALDMDTLIALVKAGESDAVEEIKRRMLGTPTPAPVRRQAARTRTSAAPVSAPPMSQPNVSESGPVTVKVGLTGDAKLKATASDVRRNLYSQVTYVNRKYGVEIHVYADKSERTLTVTVTMVNAPVAVRERIARKAQAVALATRGVDAPVHV